MTRKRNPSANFSHRGRTVILCFTMLLGMAGVVLLASWVDKHPQVPVITSAEEELYVKATTAKRLSLAFNGLAADWYWMRTLQYVGRKALNFQNSNPGQMSLNDLGDLDLRILSPLLRLSTTLDPQFIAPYQYGAMILPTFDSNEAISLLTYGIQQNPEQWRLYQHLGYVYWQRQEFQKSAEIYAAGGKLPKAPAWMAEMGARMTLEAGSREGARQMYQHLYQESSDEWVKQMLLRRMLQVDSFEQRDRIRAALKDYSTQTGKCPASWKDVAATLRQHLRLEPVTGAPLDPAGTPYVLVKGGCDVDVDPRSQVPYR